MYKTVNTDSFEIDKKNVIMISAVQRFSSLCFRRIKRRRYLYARALIFLEGGIYRCFNAYTQELCSDAKELRDLTVSEIESTVIQSWKAGREREKA